MPTVAETVPGYEMTVWYGAFGPPGMPKEIVAKLNGEIARALFLPDVKKRMDDIAVEVASSTPEELGDRACGAMPRNGAADQEPRDRDAVGSMIVRRCALRISSMRNSSSSISAACCSTGSAHLYRKLFNGDDAAMERFLGEICTMAWHLQHDAGRPFEETCAELKRKHPGHDALIDAFADRHGEMTAGAITGTVTLFERLSAQGVPLYAITNYPAQTFPVAQRKFPFLALFRDVAVSGYERVVKPSAELFNILSRRPCRMRLIFDRRDCQDVEAARSLGLHAIHFRSADELERGADGARRVAALSPRERSDTRRGSHAGELGPPGYRHSASKTRVNARILCAMRRRWRSALARLCGAGYSALQR